MTESGRPQPRKPASLAVWAALLLLLALGARFGALRGLDAACAGWVAPLRSAALDHAARVATGLGGSVVTLAALLGLALLTWKRAGQRAAVWLVAVFAAGGGLEMVLRWLVAQWRPDLLILPTAATPWLSRLKLAGFPSGHAYRSAFVFGYAAREWPPGRARTFARTLCLLVIIIVGITRIYLNRHWASDVVGGWLVAQVVLALTKCQTLFPKVSDTCEAKA